ncbi:RimJ/RimL family protein N-acetyltransferase [Saccharopolyspora lacisalsi]|uniref:RimJ/RimL family protein N-acetyltransferase n=1 Tax=Halosaccharopolyspora lacisalsi TaxID=1000566 RepID=A0A839DV18_9PSEU|nr:GNAT family N-acetyltransferase [Halosaccharopolyspora lacisalsi]MBA8824893.1 RimJ/RimL family protein N-acetyltransferase [Halosaccharopolyspora lacisalsi]
MGATYVIVVDARVVGAARLEPTADAVEAGVWIGRSHRGRGIGKVVLTHLRDVAAKGGVLQLTASTTAENTAARCLLDRGGARITADGTDVAAILGL